MVCAARRRLVVGLGLRDRHGALRHDHTLHVLGLPEDAGAFALVVVRRHELVLTPWLVLGLTRASQEHPIA